MSGHEETLWKWALGTLATGCVTVLGWVHVRINRVEDGFDKKIEAKVSKDVFEEFKEANENYHKGTHKRLDDLAKKLE